MNVYSIPYTFNTLPGWGFAAVTDLPINTASRAAQVYERILERISTGHYPQGHSLIELELGTEFGVSRTPVREALFRLVEYGLAEVDGRSIRVTVMSTDDVRDLFQVRQVLEVEAVRLACGRLTSKTSSVSTPRIG